MVNKHQILSRLEHIASDINLPVEWERVSKIIKPQIELGKPTKLLSKLDAPSLVSGKCKFNVQAKTLSKLFKQAGYTYRHPKTEYEFGFAYNDIRQLQWILLDGFGQVQLSTY